MPDEPKLSLRANAYGFLNESMRNAESAQADPWQWKFAVVNAAQAIELLLKERLRREHPLLVYTNIDKPRRHTVSLEYALERLKSCGVILDAEDLARLQRAKDIRNDIVHFELNVSGDQLRATYLDLFEFAHVFHERELGAELHDSVPEELWPTEAELMEDFRRDFVTYQGYKMIKNFPSEVVTAQFYPHFHKNGDTYDRIRYGDDWLDPKPLYERPKNCNDCGVLKGQFHTSGCDHEQCPRCKGQVLACPCEWSWSGKDWEPASSIE